MTSIKFSVCPKLTNTAHCFIQWHQSINKAQLLSLSAFLHFRITVSYVDAGASDADMQAPAPEVCGQIPCDASGMGQDWSCSTLSRDTQSLHWQKKCSPLKLITVGKGCKHEWHLSPWPWLSTHLLSLFSFQNECTIKTQSISMTFPKCAVSVAASLLALARSQISWENELLTLHLEKLQITGCQVGTNQPSNLLLTN